MNFDDVGVPTIEPTGILVLSTVPNPYLKKVSTDLSIISSETLENMK